MTVYTLKTDVTTARIIEILCTPNNSLNVSTNYTREIAVRVDEDCGSVAFPSIYRVQRLRAGAKLVFLDAVFAGNDEFAEIMKAIDSALARFVTDVRKEEKRLKALANA